MKGRMPLNELRGCRNIRFPVDGNSAYMILLLNWFFKGNFVNFRKSTAFMNNRRRKNRFTGKDNDMMTRKIGMLALAAFLCGNASAVVWFVNQETGDDIAAKADLSGNTPFKTIQAAIDYASDDDTVKVGPGTYNTTLAENDYGRSRIFIDKPIILEATGNRDNTVIEGAWHSSENYGLGANAIRCICATASCTIKGFTLRNGATPDGKDSDLTSGGGLLVPKSNDSNVKILDCAIENCSSTRGGGMRRCTAYRTIFARRICRSAISTAARASM